MTFLYFCFVIFTLLVPGLGFTHYISALRKGKGEDVKIALSIVLVIIFFAICGVLLYAIDVPKTIIRTLLGAFLILGTILFIKTKSYKLLVAQRFIILVFVFTALLPTLVLSLTSINKTFIPDPTYKADHNYSVLNVKVLNFAHTPANDNYIPYRQAQFFINNSDPGKDSFIDEWGVSFFQRTVLMGSVASSYFVLDGDSLPIAHSWGAGVTDPDQTYLKFQIIAHILNSLFIIASFTLLKRLFDKKVAMISILFLSVSQFYLYNSIFSWPKSLAAFFILLSIYFALSQKRNHIILAGVLSGIAYMVHDLAIIYIGTIAVLLLFKKRLIDLVYFFVSSAPFPIIWGVISSVLYNKPSTFIYYPFSLYGLPQDSNKSTLVRSFLHTNPIEILRIKLHGVAYLMSPYQLLTSEGGKNIDNRMWALGIYSVPGSLGFGTLLLGTLTVIKWFKRVNWEVLLLILMPCVFIIFIFGDPSVLGSMHFAEPLLAILTGLILKSALKFKQRNWLIILAFGINIFYFMFFVLYSFNYQISLWAHSMSDILASIFIIAIIAILAVILWLILNKENGRLSGALGIADNKTATFTKKHKRVIINS